MGLLLVPMLLQFRVERLRFKVVSWIQGEFRDAPVASLRPYPYPPTPSSPHPTASNPTENHDHPYKPPTLLQTDTSRHPAPTPRLTDLMIYNISLPHLWF
ncbi:hypothetical protein VNO78_20149 [Psophocarpus tetragonolobus]|uniref:Uncharacterized protein n=1 Tax=Psophocarpus tetragonolobus TaxID=3891 RepID=A0AAN9SAS9_PSOTE